MLQLKGIYKTFNAGTVNEKRAIDNLNLTLEDGGTGADLLGDLGEGVARLQHFGDLQALGHGLDLAEGAQIVEEAVALLKVLERENGFKQMIGLLRLHLASVHNRSSLQN